MTYSELSDLCQKRKIFLKEVCRAVEMTDVGFKNAIEVQSFPIKKMIALCDILEITPNQFFGVKEPSGDVVYGGQNKQGRKQIINNNGETVKILQDQLAKKDAQIEKLLSIIANK